MTIFLNELIFIYAGLASMSRLNSQPKALVDVNSPRLPLLNIDPSDIIIRPYSCWFVPLLIHFVVFVPFLLIYMVVVRRPRRRRDNSLESCQSLVMVNMRMVFFENSPGLLMFVMFLCWCLSYDYADCSLFGEAGVEGER